jgi:hypothetical protein
MNNRDLALSVVVFVIGAGLLTGPAHAQGRGRGQAKKETRAETSGADININIDTHRRIVREYYASNSLPPGLAKRQSLPPGLQKQLRERGTLPPGLQKRLVPVSPVLVARLPPLPSYYARYFLNRDLIVVDTRSNRIARIIADVIP